MTIQALKNKLARAGLDAELIKLWNEHGQPVTGICVNHNYPGYYPTKEALQAHETASNAARKAGYHSEPRGSYTATYIWRRS